MILKADLVQNETDPPSNKWCCSGHVAPPLYKRSGPNSPAEPTKFFLVTGDGINGIYCEPCLVVAHWMAEQNKKNKGK